MSRFLWFTVYNALHVLLPRGPYITTILSFVKAA